MFFWGAVLALLFINGQCEILSEKKRDFTYQMTAGRSYTRQISYGGPTLKIGSFPQFTLPDTDSNTEMKCKLSSSRTDYRDVYATRAYFDDEAGTAKALNSSQFADYFVFRKKELWSCYIDSVGLIRVVNEIIGRKEIFKVIFPDGVEVFTRSLRPRQRTVIFREIKYLDLFGIPVRYDGWFKFAEYSVQKDFFIPDLRLNLKVHEREVQGNGFKEIKYVSTPQKFDSITTTASTLTVGDESTDVDIVSSHLDCKKYQGANPFPFYLRPKCVVEMNKQPVAITSDNYFQYFTPIKDELWVCDGQNNLQVLRLVNEFLTTFEVGSATVYSEVVELRKVDLHRTQGVRVKTVRYFNHSSYEKQMAKYEGLIKLMTSENRELQILSNYAEQEGNGESVKEFDYHLHEKCVFKAMISSKGYSIKLGMRFQKIFGKDTDEVTCTMQPSGPYLHEYGTRFRLSLHMGGKHFLKAVPRSKHTDYWDFKKQEVWLCESEAVPDIKFLRIINELKGLKELFEVEYHDGIQLYIRYLSGDSKSVNVFEIKYIDPISFETLMYPGKIKLEARPASTSNHLIKCFNCDGQPIRRTEDDIYFAVNSRKDKFAIENRVKGIKYMLEKNSNWYFDWKAKNSAGMEPGALFIGGSASLHYGTINDVVDCVLTDASNNIMFPTVFRHRQKNAQGLLVLKDELLNTAQKEAAGIKSGTQQVWLCQNPEMKFYRVINKLTIEKPADSLHFFDGTTLLWEPNISNKQKATVEEIKYIDFKDNRYVKYEGDLILHPKLDDVEVMSGTIAVGKRYVPSFLTKEHSDGREVIYALDVERVHKFSILKQLELETGKPLNRDKLTIIKVGKPAELPHENNQIKVTSHLSVECEWEEEDKATFRSKYIPVLYVSSSRDGSEAGGVQQQADLTTLFDRFFRLFEWEVWKCKDQAEGFQFERIVSKFSYSLDADTLDEILYYDGLKIQSGTANEVQHMFHFSETKYIKDSKVIKYDGQLKLGEKDETEGEPTDEDPYTSTLMAQAVLDINYELQSKFVYKTVIGQTGAILKMGNRYDVNLDIANAFGENLLTCVKDFNMGQNAGNDYNMKVKIGTEEQSLFKFTTIDEQKINDLFENRKATYWTCATKDKKIELTRIVNSWTAKDGKISEIIHYDGISVEGSTVNEIKYMNNEGKVVRYDGCVKFDRAEEYSPLEHEPGREIAYDLSSSLIHFRFLNDNGGPVVEVGSKWTQKYMEASEVTCHISAGARLDFKTEYHLRVSTTQVVTGGNNVKAELTLNQLNDKFKVVRNEAYECKPVGMNKVAFIKVVNKLETKVDLSAIFYTDGVSLWKSSASPGAYFIREVKFVDSQDPKTIYKFEGNVKNKFEKSTDRFDEGSSIEEERAQVDSTDEDQKQMWYKEHQAWLARGKSGYEPLEDIRYTPGVKSKIVQQFSGYNIRVGSEWVKEIGEKRQKFLCVEDKTQYDELELLPKIDVYQDYDLYALDKDTMGDYFKITSKNVLKCSKNHQSFIRVRTELVGKAAIRRVYYWPGVKAFSHKLSTSHNTVRLVELKYLDPADGYKVVKFEGTLEKRP